MARPIAGFCDGVCDGLCVAAGGPVSGGASGRPAGGVEETGRGGCAIGDTQEDVYFDLQGGLTSGAFATVPDGGGFLSQAPR